MQTQPKPTWYQFDITHNCNMNCAMCVRNNLPQNDEMSISTFKLIVDKIKLMDVDFIALTGMGEPFTHMSLFDMVNYAKDNNLPVSVTTNGCLLNDKLIHMIIDSKLDYIRFSIDQIRRINDNELHTYSEKAIFNIKSILNEIRSRQITVPEISLNTVVSRYNLEHVIEIIHWAKEIGIDNMNLIKMSTRVNSINAIPLEVEEKYFNKYHDIAKRINLDLRSTYTHKHNMECGFLEKFLFVLSNGDVTPCCHLSDYIIGNIINESIEEIWNGNKLQVFRKKWKTICGGCNLMMWDYTQAKTGLVEKLVSKLTDTYRVKSTTM